MPTSLDRLISSPPRASSTGAISRPIASDDVLEGRFGTAKGGPMGKGPKSGDLSRQFEKRLAKERSAGRSFGNEAMAFDARQRAITKIHCFNHGGGGGGALNAHAFHVARDAAGRDEPDAPAQGDGLDRGVDRAEDRRANQDQSRAPTAYLSRSEDGPSPFYDARDEGVDGAARTADWAARDKRHFRIILAAERGERITDPLPARAR